MIELKDMWQRMFTNLSEAELSAAQSASWELIQSREKNRASTMPELARVELLLYADGKKIEALQEYRRRVTCSISLARYVFEYYGCPLHGTVV